MLDHYFISTAFNILQHIFILFCDLASLRNSIISLKFCWFYLFYQFICFSIRQVVVSIDFLFFSVSRYIINITNIFSTILHISYSKDNQFPVTVSYATPNQKMKKYYIYRFPKKFAPPCYFP